MGTNSMIHVPAPLDKFDTRAISVSSWVPNMWVSMGTHGFLNLCFFFTNNNFFLNTKKLQLLNIHT